MTRKGFAQIIPVILAALIITTGLVGLSINSDSIQKKAVGKVLSDSDEQAKQDAEKAQEEQKKLEEQAQESAKKALENQNEQNTSNEVQNQTTNQNSGSSEFEMETEKGKTKIKSKVGNTEFESETENGKTKTKLQMENFKIEIEREGDRLITKIKDKEGKDVELEATEEAEILDQAEQELEDDDIKIATGSAQIGFIQKGNKVRTNFPLSVNPQTGELTVTTPAGVKIVAVLPDEAIQNMIKAGVITVVEPSPETTPPPGATSSSQTVTNASIELTTLNNKPVYIISGLKDQKFLGLIPVSIKLKTVVSSEDGSLVAINEDLFSRILDLVSF